MPLPARFPSPGRPRPAVVSPPPHLAVRPSRQTKGLPSPPTSRGRPAAGSPLAQKAEVAPGGRSARGVPSGPLPQLPGPQLPRSAVPNGCCCCCFRTCGHPSVRPAGGGPGPARWALVGWGQRGVCKAVRKVLPCFGVFFTEKPLP